MKKAFTLLELVVVIVIIGILATSGLIQYSKLTERGRSVEARAILPTLRTLQIAYYQEHQAYCCLDNNPAGLGMDLPGMPSWECQPTHYFIYYVIDDDGCVCAMRCAKDFVSGGGGKPPDVEHYYVIFLSIDGKWSYSGTPP